MPWPSIPNLFGSTSTAAANWMANLIHPVQPPATSDLFQTRVTHTPGSVSPSLGGAAGQYTATQDPIASINARTDLTPQEKATLIQSWHAQGPGFITVTPQNIQNPEVLRHEQIHEVYNRGGLAQQAPQIAATVDPGMRQWITSNPLYRDEIRGMGLIPAIADEGTAYSLTTDPRLGGADPRVYNLLNSMLANRPQLQTQLKALAYPAGQSQKSTR